MCVCVGGGGGGGGIWGWRNNVPVVLVAVQCPMYSGSRFKVRPFPSALSGSLDKLLIFMNS